MTTVSDIFTRVKNLFGDQDGTQITEAMCINWINDAQKEAVMQHENLHPEEAFINTVDGTQVYTLPADLLSLTHVWYSDGDTYFVLKWMSPTEFNEYIDGWSGSAYYGEGFPLVYTRIKESEITLFPIPDTSVTNGLKVVYSRYPVDVSVSGSTIDLPKYYDQFVEHFCMMKAYELDENWEASDRKAALVQNTLDFNNNREAWYGRERYPSVMPVAEDYL